MNMGCMCRSGRDHDGSEFGPCEHCEALEFEARLKPPLLRSLIGFWSDVEELRQRAGINVGASPAAWRALNGLVDDGFAECSGSDLQYRITPAGIAALNAGYGTMKTARKGTSDKIENRLSMHARFLRQLEGEGWDRAAASSEALRMLEKIEKKDHSNEPS